MPLLQNNIQGQHKRVPKLQGKHQKNIVPRNPVRFLVTQLKLKVYFALLGENN